jgi:L-serine dehydratase
MHGMRPVSVLDVLKPAVGPSSSHTFGPLLAARDFAAHLPESCLLGTEIRVVLAGSLAHTGRGHLTDAAILAGLAGLGCEHLLGQGLQAVVAGLSTDALPIPSLSGRPFRPRVRILFDPSTPTPHPNMMRFEVRDDRGRVMRSIVYYSVGGGRLIGGSYAAAGTRSDHAPAFSMSRVIAACEARREALVDYVRAAEESEYHHAPAAVDDHMRRMWDIMRRAMSAGLQQTGILPGRLGVERRAAGLLANYQAQRACRGRFAPDTTLASIYAIAVAEENAAGGMVVTAPTCGSSGVLPACLRILQEKFLFTDSRICEALLVAGLIGSAAVARASIAGAVVGCQGEIGVASAMAAAACCYLLGGSVRAQIDRAAETALEHFLGLACDPVGGLVQIPCIERNAAGVVSALNAANLSLLSDGRDFVSLDATLDAMREIGYDMPDKYRETSLGGLAAIDDLNGDGVRDAR